MSVRYDPETDKLEMSKQRFKFEDLNFLGKMIIRLASAFKLLHVEENIGEDKKYMEINNMTTINFFIKIFGPIHEQTLTMYFMIIQVSDHFLCYSYHFDLSSLIPLIIGFTLFLRFQIEVAQCLNVGSF